MAIRIKGINRIVVAVEDMDKARERYEKLFAIKPFAYGAEPEKGFHWLVFELGSGETKMEFLSPLGDAGREKSPVAKFINKRGEGVYMITLETAGNVKETNAAMYELGLTPAGGVIYNDMPVCSEGIFANTCYEYCISPKDTHGVLFNLASLEYKDIGVWKCKPGRPVSVHSSKERDNQKK